jgi:hypothetical protein
MSEPIPESIPTSQDPKSKRPLKRRALTPVTEQAAQIGTLFKDPTKEIRLPPPSKDRKTSSLPPPPEIVANVQGSSAGAGSGEFHVYKASRRREYERMRVMDEEVKREKADEEFERKREEARRKDEERTEKNRKKREKRKATKNKKGTQNGTDGINLDKTPVKRLGPQTVERRDDTTEDATEGTAKEHYEEPGVIIHDED